MAKKKAAKKKAAAPKTTRKEKSRENKAKHVNVSTRKPKGKSKGKGKRGVVVYPVPAEGAGEYSKDLNIETVLDMIIDGRSYDDMAANFSISLRKLHYFMAESDAKDEKGELKPPDMQNSARVREALITSAHKFEQMAEDVLKDAEKGKRGWRGFIKLEQAKQLAQHYRWRASKRYPKGYGDKVQQEHSGVVGIQQITGMTVV